MKGTCRKKILDYREPLFGEMRKRAFFQKSPLSFLLKGITSKQCASRLGRFLHVTGEAVDGQRKEVVDSLRQSKVAPRKIPPLQFYQGL